MGTKYKMANAPVLLLIFNRPDYTRQVFESIKKAQPARLYIAADGPRKGNEQDIQLCAETKAVVEQIEWPCEVKRLYRKENLSCDFAIIDAVNWFFSFEEYGIIIEDDCKPAVSFFEFCTVLLDKYRNDENIAMISGTSFLNNRISEKYNFFKGDFMYTWGFATWKRVWKDIDFYKKIDIPAAEKSLMQRYDHNRLYVEYHIQILRNAEKEPIVYWDYSFFIHNLQKGMVGIIPTVNLISNIGNSGTHFSDSKSLLLNTVIQEIYIGADFSETGITLSKSQKKKIMKTIVQKIYPVGFRNRMYFLKQRILGFFKK